MPTNRFHSGDKVFITWPMYEGGVTPAQVQDVLTNVYQAEVQPYRTEVV